MARGEADGVREVAEGPQNDMTGAGDAAMRNLRIRAGCILRKTAKVAATRHRITPPADAWQAQL
jgi:hypothetical protein